MTGRLLVAYSATSTHVTTTLEYLSAFTRHSRWDVQYVHVTNGAELNFDFNEFDAVLNSYCVRLCVPGYPSASYVDQMKRFRGIKLAAVQDEYEHTNVLRQSLKDIGFHVVLTCVPQQSVSFVYPPAWYPETEFITVLTGYVPDDFPCSRRRPLDQRPIVIGGRGRDIGGKYGRLGFEKLDICRRMRAVCEERNIPYDIEWSDDKRVYGRSWYDFLASCRAVIGSESGCNIFDFDGTLAKRYDKLALRHSGGLVSYDEFRQYTDPREAEVDMGQISPRVFECAAMRSAMVLFEGRYSDAIKPWDHFIPLAKDFSNIDEVLRHVEDIDFLAGMTERAYDHLIGSGQFSHRQFVAMIDDLLDRKQRELATPKARPRRTFSANPQSVWLQRTLEEQPTDAPRPVEYFYFKQLARENEALRHTSILRALLPPGSRRYRLARNAWRALRALR